MRCYVTSTATLYSAKLLDRDALSDHRLGAPFGDFERTVIAEAPLTSVPSFWSILPGVGAEELMEMRETILEEAGTLWQGLVCRVVRVRVEPPCACT